MNELNPTTKMCAELFKELSELFKELSELETMLRFAKDTPNNTSRMGYIMAGIQKIRSVKADLADYTFKTL